MTIWFHKNILKITKLLELSKTMELLLKVIGKQICLCNLLKFKRRNKEHLKLRHTEWSMKMQINKALKWSYKSNFNLRLQMMHLPLLAMLPASRLKKRRKAKRNLLISATSKSYLMIMITLIPICFTLRIKIM